MEIQKVSKLLDVETKSTHGVNQEECITFIHQERLKFYKKFLIT